MRDKLYSEIRVIGEMAEKLAHRANMAAAKLAELPVPDQDESE